ncbi:short-chain dehydrogenase/reductase SDR [Calothrix sp. NIES-4071]|nr:short-chain dehydrogenase/reductase SDR [Calothrix sp. NIES-4071]BAZ59853.1 short-chain dehydrogenase/reductase SDR [Calothrix sp. NIES-4105]
MAILLKSLRNQVIVITGASSGIGLVTARMAAYLSRFDIN